mmetsp:Transcript_67129/g.189081  ORF Transcript_67129/g.189081 Transcript_67129/m.189081 type:complete len:111 (+) Transcript_67129:1165-1497(+)
MKLLPWGVGAAAGWACAAGAGSGIVAAGGCGTKGLGTSVELELPPKCCLPRVCCGGSALFCDLPKEGRLRGRLELELGGGALLLFGGHVMEPPIACARGGHSKGSQHKHA